MASRKSAKKQAPRSVKKKPVSKVERKDTTKQAEPVKQTEMVKQAESVKQAEPVKQVVEDQPKVLDETLKLAVTWAVDELGGKKNEGERTKFSEGLKGEEKEVQKQIKLCIGELKQPWVGGQLWAALNGRAITEVTQALVPFRQNADQEYILRRFLEAGESTVPPSMVGDSAMAECARRGARLLLLQMFTTLMRELLKSRGMWQRVPGLVARISAATHESGEEALVRSFVGNPRTNQALLPPPYRWKPTPPTCFKCGRPGHKAYGCKVNLVKDLVKK